MNDIQYYNRVWIIISIVLLYYGISGDSNDMFTAIFLIIVFFCLFWFLGSRQKAKEDAEKYSLPMGQKARGQWGR